MALAFNTLSTELAGMTPTMVAAEGAQRLAEAYGAYMKGARAGNTIGSPAISASAVDGTAVPAMAAAMGFSAGATASDGAGEVLGGMQAFWATMVAAPAAFFAGATVITPPPFAEVQADLASAFASNVAADATLEEAAEAIASVLHGATDGLGTATISNVVRPIT